MPYNHDRYLDAKTSALRGRPLPHLPRPSNVFEETLPSVDGLQSFSLGEDNLEEAISRRPFGAELGLSIQTDDTPALQRAPGVLALLVQFYLRPAPPQPNNRVAVLTSITHHLGGVSRWLETCLGLVYICTGLRDFGLKCNGLLTPSIARRLALVSQWLWAAPALAYDYADRRNFGIEAYGSYTTNRVTSHQTEETLNALPRGSSAQSQPPTSVPRIPVDAPNAPEPTSPFRSMPSDPIPTVDSETAPSDELYFWPTSLAFRGHIKQPQGHAARGGVYSDVFCCDVHFRTWSEGLPTKVGMKVLRSVRLNDSTPELRKERMLQRFQQEGITWFGLLKHPNIVPLIGWTLTPSLSFISPWYEKGNLLKHLRILSDMKPMQPLLGIAKGLEYLHSQAPPVVHGDLKPENILLSDEGQPLLADFGLSTILGEEEMYSSSHRLGGSLAWMAPECMTGGARSCQSDVYSFGNLAFAVLTGELPYKGLADCQITLKVCDATKPGGPVEDWSKYPRLRGSIGDLLRACWSRSPEARPSISTIVERLTKLLALIESENGTQPSSSTK
ncbi:hypothetical protein FRC01_009254 [Tulasnella sp. 417]|nr:hypothetical protein FRC01_009254 [Tulasnella sp. 417]